MERWAQPLASAAEPRPRLDCHKRTQGPQKKNEGEKLYRRDAETAEKRRDGRKIEDMKMGGGKILEHSAAEPQPRRKQKKHHRWTRMNTDFTEANRKRRRACRAEKLGNKTLPQRRGDRQRNAGMAGESQPGWIAT